jgi:hypothetical protein
LEDSRGFLNNFRRLFVSLKPAPFRRDLISFRADLEVKAQRGNDRLRFGKREIMKKQMFIASAES